VFKPRKPIIAGLEFSGRVVEVGKNVSRFKVGDLVFGWPGKGKGTHAEYVCMPALGAVDLVPANMNLDEAASIFCGGMTGAGFSRESPDQGGAKCADLWSVGRCWRFRRSISQALWRSGHRRLRPHEPGPGESLGADAVIDYTKEDFSKAGRVTMSVVDTVGKSGFARSMRALKRGGTYVLIGGSFLPSLRWIWASVTGAAKIVSPFAGATVKDLGPYIHSLKELIESGKLRTVVSQRYPFGQIAQAHAHADTGHKVGSVLVLIAESSVE
jgi:NADPH:quinone reductase-like Zn-dependent oxidoreductase